MLRADGERWYGCWDRAFGRPLGEAITTLINSIRAASRAIMRYAESGESERQSEIG